VNEANEVGKMQMFWSLESPGTGANARICNILRCLVGGLVRACLLDVCCGVYRLKSCDLQSNLSEADGDCLLNLKNQSLNGYGYVDALVQYGRAADDHAGKSQNQGNRRRSGDKARVFDAVNQHSHAAHA